ncbi:MAG: 23S rRNA (uridine2552-2'-O)-methyltransferase [Gammaproteobacteria bacterium]|jgi:23S rRNA (uridine2552-2'-O)-methyltransferase
MKRNKSWIERQEKDPFVKQAQNKGYRSRAVFKLQAIDKKDCLFRSGQTIVDLGAAPGSWSQYVSKRIQPDGRIIAVDILDMPAINNVDFIQGDFSDPSVFERCLAITGSRNVDLVISDLAPNLSGIRDTDQARSMYLADLVLEFACQTLSKKGSLLIKLFQGYGIDNYRNELNVKFQKVTVRKPDASRESSREFYILARGFKI